MREIDHPHHAENDRQPDAYKREAGDSIKHLDRQERSVPRRLEPLDVDSVIGLISRAASLQKAGTQ